MRFLTNILFLAAVVLLAGDLEAKSFQVLVMDAVSGKPQSNMHVDFFCRDSRHNYQIKEESTDSAGVAAIDYPCEADQKIVIDVTGLPKEQCGSSAVVADLDEISFNGIISAPDATGEMHCTTKISRKLKPTPGKVVIFVKKPSWAQSHF